MLVAVASGSLRPALQPDDSPQPSPVLSADHEGNGHGHGSSGQGVFNNVLHMISDDLSIALPNYGHRDVIAPNLKKLGETSLTFDMAYTQFSQCAPSRTSFMTGRRPHRTGVLLRDGNFRKLARDVHGDGDTWSTLPEHFKNHGFTTLGCGKTWHPSNPPNHDAPRSWSDDFKYFEFTYDISCDHVSDGGAGQCCPGTGPPKDTDVSKIDTWHAGGSKTKRRQSGAIGPPGRPEGRGSPGCSQFGLAAQSCQRGRFNRCAPDDKDETYYDHGLANAAIERLRAAKEPFFLQVGFARPHAPWRMPKRFWDLYERKNLGLALHQLPPDGMPGIAWRTRRV